MAKRGAKFAIQTCTVYRHARLFFRKLYTHSTSLLKKPKKNQKFKKTKKVNKQRGVPWAVVGARVGNGAVQVGSRLLSELG